MRAAVSHLAFLSAFVAVSFVVPAYAQTSGTGTTTGSGAITSSGSTMPKPVLTLEEKVANLKKLLVGRAVDSRQSLTESGSRLTQFLKDTAAYEKTLAGARGQCRADIRRSNKDTILQITLSCYRSDLMTQLEYMRKETTYVKQLNGLLDARKATTVATLKQVSDAMTTIVTAIDSGVYEHKDDVLIAKEKLWKQYIRSRYLSLMLLRADRTLGWIGLFGQRIGQILSAGDVTDAARAKLTESADCLTLTASQVVLFEDLKEYESTKIQFGQFQSSLGKCLESLRAAAQLQTGNSTTGSGSQMTAPEASSGSSINTK